MAARNGLTVVVQELLAKGASVLAVDENGKFKIYVFFLLYTIFFQTLSAKHASSWIS